MQQLDTLTAEDWKAHSETVQQGIFDKLDRLEEGKLAAQERETLCEQVRTEIRQLKREYNRMIGCMAEAATSIDEMETRLKHPIDSVFAHEGGDVRDHFLGDVGGLNVIGGIALACRGHHQVVELGIEVELRVLPPY